MTMRANIDKLKNGASLRIGPEKTRKRDSFGIGGTIEETYFDFGEPHVFREDAKGAWPASAPEAHTVKWVQVTRAADGESGIARFATTGPGYETPEVIVRWDDLHDIAAALASAKAPAPAPQQ